MQLSIRGPPSPSLLASIVRIRTGVKLKCQVIIYTLLNERLTYVYEQNKREMGLAGLIYEINDLTWSQL